MSEILFDEDFQTEGERHLEKVSKFRKEVLGLWKNMLHRHHPLGFFGLHGYSVKAIRTPEEVKRALQKSGLASSMEEAEKEIGNFIDKRIPYAQNPAFYISLTRVTNGEGSLKYRVHCESPYDL